MLSACPKCSSTFRTPDNMASQKARAAWNLPNHKSLCVLSTDIYKAFDTVSIAHIERSLDFFQFPEEYKNAFMVLARHGTIQFEVNGNMSGDYELNRGTGQGDPKSSGGFNL